jgi:hypothetical protein
MKLSYLIVLGAFFLLTCTKQVDSVADKTFASVKTIETVFLSHQADTKEKDQKTVAVVEFLADGTIKNATQYMTYPYTHMEKEEFVFWTQPNHSMLPHLLDGLTLAHAEKNFLYGNSWPSAYVEMIDKMGHPQFPKKKDVFSSFTSTVDYDGEWPVAIKTEPGFDEDKDWFLGGYEEKFSYQEQKVTSYAWRHIISEKMLLELQEAQAAAIKRKNGNSKSSIRSPKVNQSSFAKVNFIYAQENLMQVVDGQREHRFLYENNLLTKTEYYINGVLMNHRIYYYFDNGLKEKTVIFNTNNEPEYTITYRYSFFEES